MKVSKVWVKKWQKGKLLGFADIDFSLDNSNAKHVTWKGFKLFEGDNGIQISLPSKKDEEGKLDDNGKPRYYPVIYITKEETGGPGADFLEMLRTEVEKAYHSLDKQSKGPTTTQGGNGGSGEVGDDDIPF